MLSILNTVYRLMVRRLEPMVAETKLLYNIPEVMDATGYSRSFIYLAITGGALKAIRKGRTIRISVDDLKKWIEDPE
jgi:excisionase family DNA binding protein